MSNLIYYFGPYQLDPAERRMLRDGETCNVPPRVFDLLVYLVERRGSLVSKQELTEGVWPGVFVEEATLARAVSDLRKILGAGEDGAKYIETVPKFGYRFVHEVQIPLPGQTPEEPAVSHRGRLRRKLVAAAVCVAAVAGWGGLKLWWVPSGELRSIAILPFRVEGDGGGDSKGGIMTADTLITNLSRATTLEVRSMNAVRKYADREADPVHVGRELRVDAVLEGSLQWSGERVRLNARLVRVSDGQSLWSGVIEEKAVESFALQDRLATEIASSIDSRLTESQRKALLDHGTSDVLAHQAAMRGRQYFALRSGEGFRRANECFEEAIRRDPEYAEAHAYLAEALLIYSGYGYMTQDKVISRVRQEARRSIDLNPRLADPHRVLAIVAENYDYDRITAEREYKLALALNPRDAAAHHYYAELLGMMGRFEESHRRFEIADRLDPNSPTIQKDWAKIEYFERKGDVALSRIRRVMEADPGYPEAHLHLCFVRFGREEYDEALEALSDTVRLLGLPRDLPITAVCLAAQGKDADARLLVRQAEQSKRFSHLERAKVLAWTGEPEEAVRELEEQLRQHDTPGVIGLEVDPMVDPLRFHPGFQALLRRMGAVEPEVVRKSAALILSRRAALRLRTKAGGRRRRTRAGAPLRPPQRAL